VIRIIRPQGAALLIRSLPISAIRRDGETQQRVEIHPEIVAGYAALMRDGVVFPPIRAWWDGRHYWLSDGFHRVEAADRAGLRELYCEVRLGTLADAQWDSYAANSTHGPRRTAAEIQNVIALALQHSKAASLSNIQIARRLNVAETTVRRWRRKLSSTGGEDAVRIVTRKGTRYKQRVAGIGKHSHPSARKSLKSLQEDLELMKSTASPEVRRVLNVFANWAFRAATREDCMLAMKRILKDLRGS